MTYSQLIARHSEYISPEALEKIRESRLFFLGCGLGSQVAVLAARMGFQHFILADGDNVEEHNLNRQCFTRADLGRNKAEVTAEAIRGLNPEAGIEYSPEFLRDPQRAEEMIRRSDFVVNMADPDPLMYFVNDFAQQEGKVVFFPLNIIWSSFLLIFTSESARLEDLTGPGKPEGTAFYFSLLENTLPGEQRERLAQTGDRIMRGNYIPQFGPAVYLTSALIVSSMVKYLSGERLSTAPKPICIDLWNEITA